MLRSCTDAPSSSASRTTGRRRTTVGSAASSSIVVSAPTRTVAPVSTTPRSGSRVMSTSLIGSSTPSFIRSTWVVPPARYAAPGSPACVVSASGRLAARTYSKVRMGVFLGGDVADGGDDVRVRRAAADVAAHELADVGVGPGAALVEQRDRGHDLPGSAVAALETVVPDERLLHRVWTPVA